MWICYTDKRAALENVLATEMASRKDRKAVQDVLT